MFHTPLTTLTLHERLHFGLLGDSKHDKNTK